MHDSPLLFADQISKRFGSTQALSNVSIRVNAGEVLALLGENGAGKSTLVKILSGVVQADSGRVLLDGEVVHSSARAAEHSGIHLVHQELALLPDRTVAQNVFLGQELRSRGTLDWKSMRARTAKALQSLGVDGIEPNMPLRELATAGQQMVEIAKSYRD